MTLVREYQPTFVLGDGETKEFSYLFEEVSENFIKVIVKHSDDSTYTPVFSVDLDSHKVVFGESETAPLDTDIICIYRETPDLQDTPFRTLQGYDAKALENILSKIVAMIQELKANGFSTQILQGTPWQLDLLHPADDGASVVVDYNARILKKGLYFQIVSGNLQVSADGNNFIKMPKSADITEFRRLETVLEDLTVQYRLQYKVDGVWYNAESNAEATADEALQVAQDAKDIAQAASDKVDTFDVRLAQAEEDSSDAKQDASDAKDIAQTASDAVSGHITDTNNPHSVTAAQTGALPNTTKYGANLSLTVDSTTYVVTAQLKDQDGNNLGTAQTIDLPLESVVVSGAYDSVTKEVVLTLQDGSKIRFSVADLVSGLQTEITALNMLSADLVDDTNTTHKFVTTTEKSTWSGKQDAISDLATIRSNAQAGKAASDTIATYGDIVTHDVSEFATAAQGTKADTAVQPGDLATVATSGNYSDLTGKPIEWITYNTTSFADIKTAWDAGKLVLCSYGDRVYVCSYYISGSPQYFYFTCAESYTTVRYLRVSSTDAWVNGGQTNQPVISDLATIRSGAAAGVTAVQPGDLATVATTGSYTDLLNKPTIPTVNNPTITITQGGVTKGSFTLNQSSGDTIALDAGGGGSIDAIDGLTITKNSDDEIQAVATVNANTATGATNPIYDWVGTLAEYNAQDIENQHPDWICYITDDVSGGASVYTKTEVDNNFVGKGHEVIEFQEPTSANNHTWYRKYADGWVEQGGRTANFTNTAASSSGSVWVNLPITMANTNYNLVGTLCSDDNNVSGFSNRMICLHGRTTTGFTFDEWNNAASSSTSCYGSWQVSGMAA